MKSLQQQQDRKQGIQKSLPTYQVRLIQHSERYADLRYHTFTTPSRQQGGVPRAETKAPQASPHGVSFSKIHPCAVLTASQLRRDSKFPSEVSLEPCDCLELFNVMSDACRAAEQSESDDHVLASSSDAPSHIAAGSDNDGAPELAASEQLEQQWWTAGKSAIDKLAPDRYFSQHQQISRSAVRMWETQLKETLVSWATEHGPAGFRAVQQILKQLRAGSWSSGISSGGTANNPHDFYRMLRLLDQQGMLPMLTFSFDRTKCECLAGEQLASTQSMLSNELQARRCLCKLFQVPLYLQLGVLPATLLKLVLVCRACSSLSAFT